jgi:hypothetical protein
MRVEVAENLNDEFDRNGVQPRILGYGFVMSERCKTSEQVEGNLNGH